MRQSLVIAARALDAAQQRMTFVANNLANINTPGYKKDNAYNSSFHDSLSRTINNLQSPEVPKDVVQVTDFSAGNFKYTGDKMNIAIEGDGFIKVQTPAGDIAYTRKGLLTLNANKQLVIGSNLVMGEGGPVTLKTTDLNIDSQGVIYGNDGARQGNISLVTFAQPYPLEKVGETLFSAKDGSVELASKAEVRQQYIEESNVSSVSSMVEMIAMMELMRSYESQQKLIQYQDESTAKMISQIGS
jgi:flagellar basal body rod protein FlgG